MSKFICSAVWLKACGGDCNYMKSISLFVFFFLSLFFVENAILDCLQSVVPQNQEVKLRRKGTLKRKENGAHENKKSLRSKPLSPFWRLPFARMNALLILIEKVNYSLPEVTLVARAFQLFYFKASSCKEIVQWTLGRKMRECGNKSELKFIAGLDNDLLAF